MAVAGRRLAWVDLNGGTVDEAVEAYRKKALAQKKPNYLNTEELEEIAKAEFEAEWAECLTDDGEPMGVFGEHLGTVDTTYIDSIVSWDPG